MVAADTFLYKTRTLLIMKRGIKMVEAVSLNELGNFLNLLVNGFDSYIFIAFVMMLTFNIVLFFKYLLSGVR